jgi:SAM-dependent methyltransferase
LKSNLVFDQPHYDRLNAARAERVVELLRDLQPRLGLRTAIDVGCGTGYFSKLLQSLGFTVTAVDGRAANLEEARRRVPGAQFECLNAEDSRLIALGKFDLVFCFGLLYHLENPMSAIRNLHAMTNHLLLVESIIYPGEEPIMGLVDEHSLDDQGLDHFAFYPTEPCLLQMMYRAGFAQAFQLANQPNHSEYTAPRGFRRTRIMLAATPAFLESKLLVPAARTRSSEEPWDAQQAKNTSTLERIRRFASKPLQVKARSIGTMATRPLKEPRKD